MKSFVPNAIQGDFFPAGQGEPGMRVIVLDGENALLSEMLEIPRLGELKLPPETPLLAVGDLDGARCCVCRAGKDFLSDFQMCSGRKILADADENTREAFGRGREMLFWRENHRFCGRCATGLRVSPNDLALVCPGCGARFYPQIAPAVIVAITRRGGEEILLAHNRRFADGVFSLIAGFVEAGESAEEAIRREIFEETSLQIKDIRYLASQAWPFPHSLMLAFTAQYAEGEARPDGLELSECRWYARGALPAIPQKGSIARAVIDAFEAGNL